MRLICPSCGAQYEVDADVIPATGRDVQCSACGHVWFEEPGGMTEPEMAAEAVPARVAEVAPLPDVQPVPADVPVQVVVPVPEAVAPIAEVPPETPPTLADAPAPMAVVRAPRRTVTPQIAEILREEAERERAARALDSWAMPDRQEEMPLAPPQAEPRPRAVLPEEAGKPGPEATTVPFGDLALAEREPAAVSKAGTEAGPVKDDLAEAVRAVVAETALSVPAATVRTVAAPSPVAVKEAAAPRRGRLPDIEEINSTLRPTGERVGSTSAATAEKARSGRGFRLGFSLVLLVAALFALAYVYAPRIIAAVPAAEPVVAPYAAAVDSGRLWLDLQLQGLVEALGTEAEG